MKSVGMPEDYRVESISAGWKLAMLLIRENLLSQGELSTWLHWFPTGCWELDE
jgi:hypothetical protein